MTPLSLMPKAESNNSKERPMQLERRSSFGRYGFYAKYSQLGSLLAMIAEGRMDLFRQIVGNIIIALGMPVIDDNNKLNNLTLYTRHAGSLTVLVLWKVGIWVSDGLKYC
jgi:hypothetical protein